MLWSKSLIPTLKEAPQEAESESHKLLLRAGLVRMLISGVYSFLPLGLRCLKNVEGIVRDEMNSCAAQEVLLPVIQPVELWRKSGRDEQIGDVMFRITDRKGRKISLGPTHEEIITDLVSAYLVSYKQLPFTLYQIQTKFRDELRPRFGLVRCCEFVMKDAYSFDRDEAGLDKSYNLMLAAYQRIFKRCGLNFLSVEAEAGVMGGKVSHEFLVLSSSGEDALLRCPSCGACRGGNDPEANRCVACSSAMVKANAMEVGHIFKLGTKYTEALGAYFLDEAGRKLPAVMGCYGIGVTRLISAIIEQHNDKNGIIWPKEVAPFTALLLALDSNDQEIMAFCRLLYADLNKAGITCLFDDRDERAGVKFKDADLIGVPLSVIVGKNFKSSKLAEIKVRGNGQFFSVGADKITDFLKEQWDKLEI